MPAGPGLYADFMRRFYFLKIEIADIIIYRIMNKKKIKISLSSDTYRGKYSPYVDDQQHNIVSETDQKYLHKDYKENLLSSFPRFDRVVMKSGRVSPDLINISDDYFALNRYLAEKLLAGEGVNWTNKQLSYMRRDVVCKRLWSCVYAPTLRMIGADSVTFIDLTANIGGDVISASMRPEVKKIIAYEMDDKVAAMLRANIDLYKYSDIVEIRGRFDYKSASSEFSGSIVIVDPPFEISNNGSHFNLSIDKTPMFNIVESLLGVGALFVILSMPTSYKYNLDFAEKYGHRVSVYYIGNKDLKMYIIGKHKKLLHRVGYRLKGPNFTGDPERDFEQMYECRLEQLY